MELYLNSTIRLHGVVLKKIHIRRNPCGIFNFGPKLPKAISPFCEK
jgi:hypothetical protein